MELMSEFIEQQIRVSKFLAALIPDDPKELEQWRIQVDTLQWIYNRLFALWERVLTERHWTEFHFLQERFSKN